MVPPGQVLLDIIGTALVTCNVVSGGQEQGGHYIQMDGHMAREH